MSDYDVLIIGGGPTGLSAGITTSKNGLTTLIIEEHSKIGYPLACGEGISVDKLLTMENMPKLDVQLNSETLKLQKHESFVERIITSQRFFFGSKGVSTANLNTVTINRPLFDSLMANKAQKFGANLQLETQVLGIKHEKNKLIINTTNNDYKANIVIGCDGSAAHSVRMMGLQPPSEYVQGVEYKIRGVYTDALDFYFDFNRFPKMHYGWVFPKKNETNVGVVVDLSSNPIQILKDFMQYLGNKKLENGEIVQKIAGIIPASGPIPKTYCDNFMAAGDAAGMTNSIFYGGIAIGIHSGMLAGKNAVKAHENGHFDEIQMSEYQKNLKDFPYADPIIQEAHKILYSTFSASEIEIIGSWINGWDITNLNLFQRVHLFLKALSKPHMLKKFTQARKLAYGFSKSRDWGF
jgi:geranylgeranyl reductase family protein